MTYAEAQSIVAVANQLTSKLFVEWAELRQEADGTYSVIIEPVYGEQQIHSDAKQASSALSRLLAEASKASDLYFTLSEDGTVVRCDGLGLASLMMEHGVGVTTESVYKIQRIDSDYFDLP